MSKYFFYTFLNLIFTSLLFLFSTKISGQSISIEESDALRLEYKLDSIILNGIDSLAFPGAQLYVAINGEVIIHKPYGYHTYQKKTKVELDHIYDLASITKVSTGLPLLMKYSMDNRFDVDAPLKKYVPKLNNSNKADLSIREILAHQAGLTPYIVFWQKALKEDKSFKRNSFSNKQSSKYPISITDNLFLHKRYKKKMLKEIRKSPVAIDTSYRYSGLFFLLLPDIIENISGQNFYECLRRTFYDPLGANKMMYKPKGNYPLEKIVPTERDTFFRKTLVHANVHDEAAAMLDGISCNAGLFSNAEDLAKLFQMYLNGGVYNGRRFLVEEAIQEFTKVQFPENDNRRGLGFDKPQLEKDAASSYIAEDASPESFGHSGFTGTFVWADPKDDILIVFLSNRVYPDRSHRKLYKMSIRPKMHQAIYDYVKMTDSK